MATRGPVVIIVGRQNVGKSSLFNRLVGKRVAIVDPRAGTTLDRIEERVDYREVSFVLVDTAGLGFAADDPYREDIERQVNFAVDAADVIVFLTDVTTGVTSVDRTIARRLLREKKPAVLAVNKVDSAARQSDVAEFYKLGFGEPIGLSVIANRGIDDLFDRIAERLPKKKSDGPEIEARIAIVGQRNVGKSTYVNALVGEHRVVVSERAGTTRDAVDVVIDRDDRRLVIIDTAGLRKRTKLEDSVELFSMMRSEGAIHRAQGCVLLLEAQRPMTDVEKKLGSMIEKSFKPVVIVLNKWDLVGINNRNKRKFVDYLGKTFPVISFAPVFFMSAKKGEAIWEPVEALLDLIHSWRQRVGTGELNRVVERVLQTAPLPLKGTREGRVLYATQTQASPPTFAFFVKHKDAFSRAYMKHIERTMREILPFKEVPMRIVLREKPRR
jgi:GTP-binding protein